MEFPYGDQSHTHHHHHHRRSDDDERDRPVHAPQPPPFSNEFGVPPPPFAQGPHYPPQPPSSYGQEPRFPPQPPAPYHQEPHFPPRPADPYNEDSYFAPPPAPQNLASHVHHVSSNPYPPGPRNEEYAPPPPQNLVSHVHHVSSDPYPPEPRRDEYAPPPPDPIVASHGGGYPHVSHVSHESGHESTGHHHHHSFQPHLPSFLPHHRHEENRLPLNLAGFVNRPTVKVYSKAEPNYYLTIRDGKLILALSNPSDESQHWYKDEKFSTRVKDSEGCPCFSLVNKATGPAMKHSVGATQPVELIPYDPDRLDESVLWTESKDLGDGYRTVRMVNNVHLNMDAYHGDEKSGGVHDGTLIVLWDWNKGDNQRWKIVPF